jgi:hypothetical protein
MGRSSARDLVFGGVGFMVCPFDTKIITARLGITHVYVGDVRIFQQTADLDLNDTIRYIPLRKQPPAGRVCVESERIGKHVRWKAAVFGVPFAFPLMDEDGTGQGKVLPPMK